MRLQCARQYCSSCGLCQGIIITSSENPGHVPLSVADEHQAGLPRPTLEAPATTMIKPILALAFVQVRRRRKRPKTTRTH